MTLPADITRCHDTGCPHDATCLRYLQREQGVNASTSHIATCEEKDADGKKCYPLLWVEADPVVEAIEKLESSTQPLQDETKLLLRLAKEAQQTGKMPDLSSLKAKSD